MIIHNFDPVLIDLGIFQIRWYSIAYILGILIGWMYANKIIKLTSNNKYNFKQVTTTQFDDLIVYLVIGIILGGRLGYVLIYNFGYYLTNPKEIFYVWNGGMSFHGGLLGVIIATIIFSNKHNVNNDRFEFQVLYGVPMHGWNQKNLENGYKVRVYVPFGEDWYNYSIRRIKENPKIATYIIKNLFKFKV